MDTQKKSDPYTWGKPIKKGPITFTPATFDGEKITILIEDCNVLFVPSVFRGNGSERKLNLCLKESGLGAIKIEQYESSLQGDVCSNVKEDYIKCKIDLDNLALFDIENKKINNTDIDWVNLNCNAIIWVKGKWESKTQVGLQLECTDLQILPTKDKISPFA